MGADLDFITCPGYLSKDQIKEIWTKSVEQSAYDNGHGGYTGRIAEMSPTNITWTTEIFDSQDEAEEYLDTEHPKWEDAWAVRYKKIKDDNVIIMWMIGGLCSS